MDFSRRKVGGYTYLGLMFIVAVLAMTSAMASVVWSVVQQRENERQLLFVGSQFAAAIERHHRRSDGGGAYPRRLEDLLGDERDRSLRRIYADPMTGSREWGLIQGAGSGIVGVYSLSNAVPVQQGRFPGANSYRDWRFIAPSAGSMATEPAASAPSGLTITPKPAVTSQPARRGFAGAG